MAALALNGGRRAAIAAAMTTAAIAGTVALANLDPRWIERYHRVPALVLAQPDRSSLALGDGKLSSLRVKARILEQRSLPTRTPITSIVSWNGKLAVASFGDGAWALDGEKTTPLALGNEVNALASDGATLYAATNDGAFRGEERIARGVFSAVAVWRGQPWFTSPRGLSTIDAQGFVTYGAEHGLVPMRPSSVAACGDALCIGAEDGLWLFDGREGKRLTSASGALPADEVTAVLFDGAHRWAATFDAGLARIGDRRMATSDGLADGRIEPRALASWRGLILAGTPSGLEVIRGDSAGIAPMHETTAISALGDELWVGYAGGIAHIEMDAT